MNEETECTAAPAPEETTPESELEDALLYYDRPTMSGIDY